MKIVSKVLICFFAILSTAVAAQVSGTRLLREIQYSEEGGKVTIVQDKKITDLLDKHLYEMSKSKGIVGYRIRIYSNSGKEALQQGPVVQAEFARKFKDINTYFRFDAPFYRLYVGDFRTRSEAMKFLKKLEREYPDAFIVKTKINYPDL